MHTVNYDAIVVELFESRMDRKVRATALTPRPHCANVSPRQPLVQVRALYTREDLETPFIAPRSRVGAVVVLIQGTHQLVLGEHLDIIFLDNVLKPLTDVARVSLDDTNLPLLTHNARWLREDVSVVLHDTPNGPSLFNVDRVSIVSYRVVATLADLR